MPYIDGKRVSNDEWTEQKGNLTQLHTSERGVNPGEEGVVLADANADTSADSDKDSDDKVVVGTKVLDVSKPDDNEADADSVAGSELSGGTPGEPSEGSTADSDDAAEDAPDTAAEAAADFVEDRKASAKSKSSRKAKRA